MKTQRNIFLAFILNLFFSMFEFVGGLFIGSVAVASDALHDFADATSIGISFLLEKKSKHGADERYTYGYTRYSVLGGYLTTTILLLGSVAVIWNAVKRIITPAEIHYDGMIVFAVIGVLVNFCAAWFTRSGDSLNQKAVNLHMLEDVLGWAVVLIGAIVMRFTDWTILDPIMSIGVAVFILVHALQNLKQVLDMFLEKTPDGINISHLREHLCQINGVLDVHHIHLWSLDDRTICATMHVVTNEDTHIVKEKVREELAGHGISHATLELETEGEHCHEQACNPKPIENSGHHHHHHSH